ncbi:MAG: hypothetical protein GWP70_08260 [Proteobacteria bacterium]|nr:hypothetical protein [Pseudomonadota bacterium]
MKILHTVRLPALMPALLLTWALALSWAMSSSAGTADTPTDAAVAANQGPEVRDRSRLPATEGDQGAGQDVTQDTTQDATQGAARSQPATLGKQRKLEERNKDVFRPSEEISEDFAAPLPTDI